MTPTLESGLFALGGALAGGFLSPYLSHKLSERSRKLDLYKQVFAVKLEAMQKVAKSAAQIFRELVTTLPEQSLDPEPLRNFKDITGEYSWLMGEDLTSACDRFENAVEKVVEASPTPSTPETTEDLVLSYRDICRAIRGELHLRDLEQLLGTLPTPAGFEGVLNLSNLKKGDLVAAIKESKPDSD